MRQRAAILEYWAGFALLFGLMAWRAWSRFRHADLWAEDGMGFVHDVLADGLASAFHTFAGYFQSIQKILVWFFLNAFPLKALPRLLAASYWIIYAAIFSQLLRPGWAWLFPSRLAAHGLLILMAFLPGLTEMSGSYCNLQWIFLFYILFLGVKSFEVPLTWTEFLAGGLCYFSTGGGVFSIPVWIYRSIAGPQGRSRTIGRLFLLLAVGQAFYLAVFLPKGLRFYHNVPLADFYEATIRSTFQSALFQPFLGDTLTRRLMAHVYPAWGTLLLVCLVLALIRPLVRMQPKDPRWLWILAFFPVLLWPVVSGSTRFECLGMWLSGPPSKGFWTSRYAFPVACAATVSWGIFLYSRMRYRSVWTTILLTCFFLASTISAGSRFWIPRYGLEPRWERTVGLLEQARMTGTPEKVDIKTYPDGWRFEYRAKAAEKRRT